MPKETDFSVKRHIRGQRMSFFSRNKDRSEPEGREIEIEIEAIVPVRHPVTGQVTAVVFLREKNGEREFPMVIGLLEARAIELELQRITPPRPFTHDLLKNSLAVWGVMVQKIVIIKLVKQGDEGTFYADIIQERRGEVQTLDSRPSDAIALALRFAAPMYAA